MGKEQTIAKYVMYHMGKARPDLSRFNTKSYKVSVRTEKESEWTVIDEVTGNTGDTTQRVLSEPINARYVKIEFTQGEQASNDRARISEFELFSNASDKSIFEMENKSLTQVSGVSATASSAHDVFTAANVINGKISAAEEGWVSAPGSSGQWLKIDLGKERTFQKYIAYHIGKARTDLPHFNSKSFKVYASTTDSDEAYKEIDSVEGNTGDETEKVFDKPITARYIKIVFNEGQQTGAIAAQRARIAEFELFQYPEDESIFSTSAENFTEHQDIVKADLTTEMKIADVPVSMNTWLSATENTMITQLESKGDKSIDLDVSAWTKIDGSKNYKTESGTQDNVVWSSRSTHNAAKDNPESWTSKAVITTKILGDKMVSQQKNTDASSSLRFTLNPQEKLYIVTTIGGGGQTYNNQDVLQKTDPLEEAMNISNMYSGTGDIENLQQKHLEWWKNYWMKSYINIGDEDYHRYYYGSLYYMGCTSRADKVAPGLFGVWVTGDQAKYNNDYHLNYNYIAPAYGMYSSNRLEAPYAMTQPILEYMPKAMEAAKNNLSDIKPDYVSTRPELANGIDGGVIYPVGLLPWGQIAWNATSPGKYINQTLDAPFAATLFISYCNYTLDEEFLLNRAYPYVEKVAKFYEQWCEKETKEDGTYQYNLYDGAHEGFFDKNSGVTIGAVQNVYEFLINNADILKAKAGVTEEQYNMWVDMYEHMSPVPVRKYTVGNFSKDVFALSEDGMILRPESASVELEFIHPGERISFDSDTTQLEIARNTVEAKEAANAGVWGNMNNTPKMFTQAIRCGYDPAYVMSKFKETNINYMNENFTIRDGHHGIEKAGAIEFINNMLVQSSNGFVKVFPNWTGADAQFKTLREKGAYLVSSSMTEGKVDYVDIVSETGKSVKLVCPWEGAVVTDEGGNKVKVSYSSTINSNEKVVEFEADAGKTYHVGEGEALPDKTKLQELYDSVNKDEKDNYTTQSWTKLESEMENAKTILDNEEAKEDEVADAFEKLDGAIKELKLRADLTGLQELYDTNTPKLEKEKYTEESRLNLQAALEAAKIILDKGTDAEVEEMETAVKSIENAVLLLEFNTVAFEDLEEKIYLAEAIQQDKLMSTSATALQAAIDEAKKITSEATPEELWNAMDSLTAVMKVLEYRADTSELGALYQQIKEQEGSWNDYTDESIASLKSLLAEAEVMLAREDITSENQNEVNELTAALKTSSESLVLKPADKTALQEAVKQAEVLDEGKYTSSSWSNLKKALTEANKVLSDETISIKEQERVNAAAVSLKDAVNNLKEKPADPVKPEEPDKPVKPEEPDKPDKPTQPEVPSNKDEVKPDKGGTTGGTTNATSVKTGDNNPIALFLMIAAGASVMFVAGWRIKWSSRNKK